MAIQGKIKLEEVLEAVRDLYVGDNPIFLNSTLLDLVYEHRKRLEKTNTTCKVKGHDWYWNHITGKVKCIYCGELKDNYIPSMNNNEKETQRKVQKYAVDCVTTIPTWSTKKYFRKIRKKTKGMNVIEFLRYLNKL